MKKIYYLDNASTTKVFPEIYDLMKKENEENYFNPSATYSLGFESKNKLNAARNEMIRLLHGNGGKLLFVSSATEANNTVAFGVHIRAGQKVLVSAGEHPSVYNSFHELEERGVIVQDIPLSSDGVVTEENLRPLLDESVALVSVIHVSNETGAVNDIGALVKLVKGFNSKIIFHADGVQAFGKIDVNLQNLGVDLYSISAHKVYAPRGIAALWIKGGVHVKPLLFGGGQEDGLRSSTENVDGAAAFAYAAKKAISELQGNFDVVKKRKNDLINLIKTSKISEFVEIFEYEQSSPYILQMSISGIKGEVLMRTLETFGVIVSTGSACSSKKAGNRILQAMGKNKLEIEGSVRVSFSPYEDFDSEAVAHAFETCIKRLKFID